MKLLKYILLGMVFGITLTKAEIISWFRIQEMFRFESFHMYGVIGSAVALSALWVMFTRKPSVRNGVGSAFHHMQYKPGWKRYLLGGIIFGLGWAMTGACPGPLFILSGAGYPVFVVAIAAALLGTLTYALLRSRLPH